MKESTRTVWNYIKEHDGEDFTARDIADATGIALKSVNPIITAAFQRHRDEDKNIVPLTVREEAVIENEDGTHETVKFIRLTDEGKAFEFAE